jgi:hypothetical protein
MTRSPGNIIGIEEENVMNMMQAPRRPRRGTVLRALVGLAITALFVASSVTAARAQALSPAMCPAGTAFRLRPFAFTPFAPGQPGIPMLRRTIDTRAYPAARCNDGSAAVMYIRPANAAYGGNPIAAQSSRWLIFFDGGGGCRSTDSCLLERWCSGSGQIFDQAGKMSSRGAPAATPDPGGIWNLNPAPLVNDFAQYNHVLVHYCSSDDWIGSSRLEGISTSTGVNFDIQFQGEAIVEAVIGTLLAGPVSADPAAQRFYGTALPPLSAASLTLIGAESAGTGVRHHIDRIRDRLQAANPAMDVRAVFDAGFAPGQWESWISWADPFSPGDYRHSLMTQVEPVTRSFWGVNDTALDASCLNPAFAAAHTMIATTSGGIVQGGHPQVCYDSTFVQLNHITTPTFVRQDINDPLARDKYVMQNLFLTPDDYWDAQQTQVGASALGVGLEAPLGPGGAQATHCQKHVVIQTNAGFFRDLVNVPGLPPDSFHDLLVNWINGIGPGTSTIQIQSDFSPPGSYTSSVCF